MARMRTIHPGYFTDEELAELSIEARYLGLALPGLADREGRLADKPKRIQHGAMPWDEVDVNHLLDELVRVRFIFRYEVGGQRFIQIRNFLRFQRPHYKEAPSLIPPPPGHEDSPVITGAVPAEQRNRILKRDGHACKRCGTTESLSIDHIVPRSKGGSGEDSNLQVLCIGCNSSKGNRDASSMINQSSVDTSSMNSGPAAWDPGSGIGDLENGIQEGEGGHAHAQETLPPPPESADADRGELAPLPASLEAASPGRSTGLGASPGVAAGGWVFAAEDLEQLTQATQELAMEPQELPAAISSRLYRRATKTQPDWSIRVPLAWNEMPARQVAEWSLVAIHAATKKAEGDRARILDLAAGAVGRELEVGADLVETSRRRSSVTVTEGSCPTAPPDEVIGWRTLLRGQGGLDGGAWVVRMATVHRDSLGLNLDPMAYLNIWDHAGRGDGGRDTALQRLWDDIQEQLEVMAGEALG